MAVLTKDKHEEKKKDNLTPPSEASDKLMALITQVKMTLTKRVNKHLPDGLDFIMMEMIKGKDYKDYHPQLEKRLIGELTRLKVKYDLAASATNEAIKILDPMLNPQASVIPASQMASSSKKHGKEKVSPVFFFSSKNKNTPQEKPHKHTPTVKKHK